jgi:hypothetical protein
MRCRKRRIKEERWYEMKNLKKVQFFDKEKRSWHKYEGLIERKWWKNYELEMKRSSRKL